MLYKFLIHYVACFNLIIDGQISDFSCWFHTPVAQCCSQKEMSAWGIWVFHLNR